MALGHKWAKRLNWGRIPCRETLTFFEILWNYTKQVHIFYDGKATKQKYLLHVVSSLKFEVFLTDCLVITEQFSAIFRTVTVFFPLNVSILFMVLCVYLVMICNAGLSERCLWSFVQSRSTRVCQLFVSTNGSWLIFVHNLFKDYQKENKSDCLVFLCLNAWITFLYWCQKHSKRFCSRTKGGDLL